MNIILTDFLTKFIINVKTNIILFHVSAGTPSPNLKSPGFEENHRHLFRTLNRSTLI